MHDNTLKDLIENENTRDKLELAPTEDKMRYIGHVQRRPIDATMRKKC